MTENTRTSGKTAAAAAAKTLLAARIKLVEDLGEALDQQHRKVDAAAAAMAAEQDATEAVRTAYAAAQDGGWSTSDLTVAGFPLPGRVRRRRRTEPSNVDPDTVQTDNADA